MFDGWSAFFTTTGAAGGTLAGLLFVVVSLGTGLHNVILILASAVLIGGGAGLIAGNALTPYAVAGSTTLFLVSGLETEQAPGSR
ncbi:hypothetical protein [Cyanobium sp. PCC 7001]|uniref:hypothetical protein n=1 Tax=Cyanobium sp. PCC 7001 TaxID=180281 RepID=UPI0002FAF602|nr:hypothetical protein [Cyanobium sp. PCC 7001]